MKSQTKFTVVATSYNDSKIVIDYFKTITNQTLLATEYVLVDGGSKDDTVALVEAFQKETGLPIRVHSGQRLNIAEGYNAAIKAAETDVIVITGIGNKYPTDFLEELLKCYEESDSAIVHTLLIGQDNNWFSRMYNNACLGAKGGNRHLSAYNRGVLIEKSVFKQVGYFYEDFIYAGEDGEFFPRANRAGIKSVQALKAKVYWDTPRNIKEYLKQKNDYYIARLQFNGYNKKALLVSLSVLVCIVVGGAFSWTPWPYLGAILFYFFRSYKIKSISPFAVAFDTFAILLYLWLSVKNRKYLDPKYRMDCNKIPF